MLVFQPLPFVEDRNEIKRNIWVIIRLHPHVIHDLERKYLESFLQHK